MAITSPFFLLCLLLMVTSAYLVSSLGLLNPHPDKNPRTLSSRVEPVGLNQVLREGIGLSGDEAGMWYLTYWTFVMCRSCRLANTFISITEIIMSRSWNSTRSGVLDNCS